MDWITEEESNLRKRVNNDFLMGMLWGFPKRIPKEDDNVKLAWVYIGNKRVMIGMDNKNMKGYKMEENIPTWKLPLEEQNYDKFERWCTTFDI